MLGRVISQVSSDSQTVRLLGELQTAITDLAQLEVAAGPLRELFLAPELEQTDRILLGAILFVTIQQLDNRTEYLLDIPSPEELLQVQNNLLQAQDVDVIDLTEVEDLINSDVALQGRYASILDRIRNLPQQTAEVRFELQGQPTAPENAIMTTVGVVAERYQREVNSPVSRLAAQLIVMLRFNQTGAPFHLLDQEMDTIDDVPFDMVQAVLGELDSAPADTQINFGNAVQVILRAGQQNQFAQAFRFFGVPLDATVQDQQVSVASPQVGYELQGQPTAPGEEVMTTLGEINRAYEQSANSPISRLAAQLIMMLRFNQMGAAFLLDIDTEMIDDVPMEHVRAVFEEMHVAPAETPVNFGQVVQVILRAGMQNKFSEALRFLDVALDFQTRGTTQPETEPEISQEADIQSQVDRQVDEILNEQAAEAEARQARRLRAFDAISNYIDNKGLFPIGAAIEYYGVPWRDEETLDANWQAISNNSFYERAVTILHNLAYNLSSGGMSNVSRTPANILRALTYLTQYGDREIMTERDVEHLIVAAQVLEDRISYFAGRTNDVYQGVNKVEILAVQRDLEVVLDLIRRNPQLKQALIGRVNQGPVIQVPTVDLAEIAPADTTDPRTKSIDAEDDVIQQGVLRGARSDGVGTGGQGTGDGVGGITLRRDLLDMQVLRDPNGIPLPVQQQPIHQMNIQGVVPILNTLSEMKFPMILGMQGESQESDDDIDELSSRDPMDLRKRIDKDLFEEESILN